MKCCPMKLVAAVAVAFGLAAETAWAFPPSVPFRPSVAQVQSMIDRTLDYGSGQASTMTRTPIPGGLRLNITWSQGDGVFNETFARVVPILRFPGDTGDGDGGDLQAFDGVRWTITSDTAVQMKPMSQNYGNFAFFEGSQDLGVGAGIIAVPGGNVSTPVMIDWNMTQGGGTSIPVADRGNMFEIGFQIFGPVPPVGQTQTSVITILGFVPEPTSMALAAFAGLALVGLANRRRREQQ